MHWIIEKQAWVLKLISCSNCWSISLPDIKIYIKACSVRIFSFVGHFMVLFLFLHLERRMFLWLSMYQKTFLSTFAIILWIPSLSPSLVRLAVTFEVCSTPRETYKHCKSNAQFSWVGFLWCYELLQTKFLRVLIMKSTKRQPKMTMRYSLLKLAVQRFSRLCSLMPSLLNFSLVSWKVNQKSTLHLVGSFFITSKSSSRSSLSKDINLFKTVVVFFILMKFVIYSLTLLSLACKSPFIAAHINYLIY